MRKRRRLAVGLAMIALWLAADYCAAHLRCNRSPSTPLGWYWLDTSDRNAEPGSYVVFCQPPSPLQRLAKRRGYIGVGPCSGGVAALLKVVAAGPGDLVEFEHAGTHINGALWPHSAPLVRDPLHRPLPQMGGSRLRLQAGQRLALSEALATGFDSRYFGPIPQNAVLGRAWPLSGAATYDPFEHARTAQQH